MERSRGRENCGQPWNKRERFSAPNFGAVLPNFASSRAGRILRRSLSVPRFSLTYTIPCFTIYHILLHTSRYLHGVLPLLRICSDAPFSVSPTLTSIEKGSPSPCILYLPHPIVLPQCTCHLLTYDIIYLYVSFTFLLFTRL